MRRAASPTRIRGATTLTTTTMDRRPSIIRRATGAGLKVILDVHNFADYYIERNGRGVRFAIGSERLPISRFADLWRRLSHNFKGTPGIVGYGLMNEPAGMPSVGALSPAKVWERASRRALDAIRSNGD